jgi:hypothetical protein
MLPFEDRFTRQRRLREVGAEGQRRLDASRMVLVDHADSDIERDYLERAGVTRFDLDPQGSLPAFPWADAFEFSAAGSVARGSWYALARLRIALLP